MERKHILVVEHEQATIALLNKAIENQFQLLQISSGERAVKMAQNEQFDLAIVTRCLPDMNGLEVLKLIVKSCRYLPVIFVAEAANNDLILSAFRSGARDFLEKPINSKELMQSINRIIESPIENYRCIKKIYLNKINKKNFSRLVVNFYKKLSGRVLKKYRVDHSIDNNFKASTVTEGKDNSKDERGNNLPTEEFEDTKVVMEVNLLGKFRVMLNEKPVDDWQGRKMKEIFAYLVFNHSRRINKDILMDKFWHNASPDSARNCLNVTLHKIRNLFQQIVPKCEYICFKDECHFIDPGIEVKLDVEEFLRHYRIAQSIEREQDIKAALTEYELAASLYKGDFMGENPYENWSDLDRENMKEIYLLSLNKLSHYYSLDGKPDTAINLCNTILQKDICREDVHRRLMKCYYRIGQRDKALKQFQKCVKVLKSELEVEPTRSTVRLYEKIKQEN